jgi:hypothetical protein
LAAFHSLSPFTLSLPSPIQGEERLSQFGDTISISDLTPRFHGIIDRSDAFNLYLIRAKRAIGENQLGK